MSELYDLVIIGSGPAGLSSAIYALRANLNALIIEKDVMIGGQILNTFEVDNYPGFPGINGFDLGMKFREHADKLGAKFIEEEVMHIDIDSDIKVIKTNKQEIKSKAIIIATGANYKLLGVPGEDRLSGRGVSYCAICDGAFYKDKVVAVVGGGDVAAGDVLFLARACKKVYLIHRREELRAAKSLQTKLLSLENVEVLWNTKVEEINGDEKVETITITDIKNNEQKELSINGVFVAIGIVPNSLNLSTDIKVNKDYYIVAGEDCRTNVEGVFVAGDLRTKELRQIVTAVSDGANAIMSVEQYLNKL